MVSPGLVACASPRARAYRFGEPRKSQPLRTRVRVELCGALLIIRNDRNVDVPIESFGVPRAHSIAMNRR